MITVTKPISPAMASIYTAFVARERFDSLLGKSPAAEAYGINRYRAAMRDASDELAGNCGRICAQVLERQQRKGA